jgi:5'-3' exonuclease
VLLFFDSRKSFRKQFFPEYKAKRQISMSEEEFAQVSIMRDQLKLLRQNILPAIGFQVHHQTGCESDDLIAQVSLQIEQLNQQGIIVTADGDLYQCITDHVIWFDPARNKWVDMESFGRDKGVATIHWHKIKMMAGCPGDGVPGIPGVGEKTAIKAYQRRLPEHLKTYQRIHSEEGRLIQERNKQLVHLPHPKTKPVNFQEPIYNTEAFFEMVQRYGFVSYLREPKRSVWERFFHKPGLRKRNGT